jgi:hypothetical protein
MRLCAYVRARVYVRVTTGGCAGRGGRRYKINEQTHTHTHTHAPHFLVSAALPLHITHNRFIQRSTQHLVGHTHCATAPSARGVQSHTGEHAHKHADTHQETPRVLLALHGQHHERAKVNSSLRGGKVVPRRSQGRQPLGRPQEGPDEVQRGCSSRGENERGGGRGRERGGGVQCGREMSVSAWLCECESERCGALRRRPARAAGERICIHINAMRTHLQGLGTRSRPMASARPHSRAHAGYCPPPPPPPPSRTVT